MRIELDNSHPPGRQVGPINDIHPNVAHLDELPTRGFRIVALPTKIQERTGATMRSGALLD